LPKRFQLQKGLAPDPLTRGSAPGPRWGLHAQTHVKLVLPRSPSPPPFPACRWASDDNHIISRKVERLFKSFKGW